MPTDSLIDFCCCCCYCSIHPTNPFFCLSLSSSIHVCRAPVRQRLSSPRRRPAILRFHQLLPFSTPPLRPSFPVDHLELQVKDLNKLPMTPADPGETASAWWTATLRRKVACRCTTAAGGTRCALPHETGPPPMWASPVGSWATAGAAGRAGTRGTMPPGSCCSRVPTATATKNNSSNWKDVQVGRPDGWAAASATTTRTLA